MRLQLAVMDEKKEIKEDFEKELIELEEMIDGYLEFARNEREEQMVDASLFKLLQQAAKTSDPSGEKITINADYVKKNLGELVKDTDLSKFIL